jgi:hypothetical protein
VSMLHYPHAYFDLVPPHRTESPAIRSWQHAIDMYILRSSTSVSTEKRPIDTKWLYHRASEFTLGLPHVHSILKRQRLMLLSQIVQDAESTTSFTWSTLARHRLDTTCGAFGCSGRHDYLWLNPNAKFARAAILLLPVWFARSSTNMAVRNSLSTWTPSPRTRRRVHTSKPPCGWIALLTGISDRLPAPQPACCPPPSIDVSASFSASRKCRSFLLLLSRRVRLVPSANVEDLLSL